MGTDRKLDPSRIAAVIAEYDPDVVALQELDMARRRSGQVDQAATIAEILQMSFHFHPALRLEDELYGDAILSKYPLQLKRAAELPTVAAFLAYETRGALWVTITMAGCEVQVLNTHLGLSKKERVLQAAALLGSEWLGNDACRAPVILCGDFNALPNSFPHRQFCSRLRDAHRSVVSERRATFPSRFPVFRLDYVFASEDIQVLGVRIPRTPLTVLASDHLPVVVDLALPVAA